MRQITNGVLFDNGCALLSDDAAVSKVRDVFSQHNIRTDSFSNSDIRAMVSDLRKKNQILLSTK